jgi:diadenosine tetraphosphate (Ap4A) HIT family hydrolase
MNRYSYNNGHLLIVKHTHESDIEMLPEKVFGALM